MSNLKLFTGNRLDTLAEKLAEVLLDPPPSPLTKEIIVVESSGMERWVSMQLARHHGICANYDFLFPNAFVYTIFRKLMPDLPESSPFDVRKMAWKIMKLLPTCVTKPEFGSLRNYLGKDARGLRGFQLSHRIADTFDQYLLFRPEMILEWEAGKEDHWQAVLWRELVRENKGIHRAALGKRFLERIRNAPVETAERLPTRVSAFGISALPRFHMQILAGIAAFTKVNLFFMNPCKEPRNTTSEKGNRLLVSMGTLGRDFFDLVEEFHPEKISLFEDPEEKNLLRCIQSDILHLRNREQHPKSRKISDPTDASIRIHSCHSPMREIEVLHDQLLRMFQEDADLMPKDILVMVPEIETYAPYIQAVFDTPPKESMKIPYSIADRSVRTESRLIDAFLAIIDLFGGRFGASQVLGILESQAVRDRFGLSDADLRLIQSWVREARIRWGIDEENRSLLGLPAFPENTWRAGLDRLLLGYAMPGKSEKIFSGILPYDEMEGGDAMVLGNFIEVVEQLFTQVRTLDESRTLAGWSETLTKLLDRFFLTHEETEREMQSVRATLRELETLQELFDEEVDIRVVRSYLKRYLEGESSRFGFINGSVTFCAMLPMRSIPFKVICLVGMNNDAYPRQSKPLSFDLIAKDPRPGDRSSRNQDRYLFLEAILSAGEKLYISYVGQSIRDNSPIPPSVVVSELTDAIEQGFGTPEHLIVRHRLQAFNPAYFEDNSGALFSYSEENFRAALQFLETRRDPSPFIRTRLPDPEPEWKTVSLDDLYGFFANPAKFLINKRLKIHLEEVAAILEETECFKLEGLEKYALEQELVERRLTGRDLKSLLPLVRASGQLPHGTVGECFYEQLSGGIESFAEETLKHLSGTPLKPLGIDLVLGDFRIIGRISGAYPQKLIHYRYAKTKPKDHLRLWILHLALNCVRSGSYPRESLLIGLENGRWAAWKYPGTDDSEAILKDLLEKYRQGLTDPLRFFPKSSWDYADFILRKNKSEEEALRKARSTWKGNDFSRGECEDVYHQLCFGNTDPLDSEFQRIAVEVFGPISEHQEPIGL